MPTEQDIADSQRARGSFGDPPHDQIRSADEARRAGVTQLIARINNDFRYHAPKEGQASRYGDIREHARQFALMLADTCPPGRELAVALTKLDEAVFWANASIARNE